jgi:hypothetical protein
MLVLYAGYSMPLLMLLIQELMLRNPGFNPGVLAADSRSIQVPIPGGDAATPCFNARFPLVDTRVYTRVDTFLYFWSRWEDFLLDGFLDVLELMY